MRSAAAPPAPAGTAARAGGGVPNHRRDLLRALLVEQGDRSPGPPPRGPALAAARALVARGWRVGVAAAGDTLVARSRAISAVHRVPDLELEGGEAFLERLDDLARREGYDIVFPGWEEAVLVVSEFRDRLSFPVGYGPHEGLQTAIDKSRLAEPASSAGIAVPRTLPASAEVLGDLAPPYVVKAARPLQPPGDAKRFATVDEAVAYAREIEARGSPALVQEAVDGTLMAVSVVAGEDGIRSIAQQVSLHIWPPQAGVSAHAVTVAIDLELRDAVAQLLSALEWRGLAQLQFLRPADGVPRLIDINPRFYGSLALAVRAGANHPDVWARTTLGLPVAHEAARPGVHYQWFDRDLRSALRDPRPLPALARSLALAPVAAHGVFSWQEPALAVRHRLEFLAARLRRSAGA